MNCNDLYFQFHYKNLRHIRIWTEKMNKISKEIESVLFNTIFPSITDTHLHQHHRVQGKISLMVLEQHFVSQ